MRGASVKCRVTSGSSHGKNHEIKDAPVGKILNVEEPAPGHFYWPDLDVDLSEEIIAHPERFPLKAK